MPIEIQGRDGSMGDLIVSRGVVTDQELVDYLKRLNWTGSQRPCFN